MHWWIRHKLVAYAAGELPHGTAQRIEAHLQTCTACRQEVAAIRAGIALAQELPLLKAPEDLWQRIAPQLEAHYGREERRQGADVGPRLANQARDWAGAEWHLRCRILVVGGTEGDASGRTDMGGDAPGRGAARRRENDRGHRAAGCRAVAEYGRNVPGPRPGREYRGGGAGDKLSSAPAGDGAAGTSPGTAARHPACPHSRAPGCFS